MQTVQEHGGALSAQSFFSAPSEVLRTAWPLTLKDFSVCPKNGGDLCVHTAVFSIVSCPSYVDVILPLTYCLRPTIVT